MLYERPYQFNARYIDEALCKRILRRLRLVDAELRADSGNNLIAFTADLADQYEETDWAAGLELISDKEHFYRGKLEYMQEAVAQVQNEAGMVHEYAKEAVDLRAHFESVHRLLEDLLHHAQARSLKTAKRRRQLLYQQK